MKNFTKSIIFTLIIITFFAAWKDYNNDQTLYIFGNTNDYQININEKSVLDINNNTKTYFNSFNELSSTIETLTYNQTLPALQDSTYVLLSGDTCFVVNYSDNLGETKLLQYNNMDIDKFYCVGSKDTSCTKTYLYYYNSEL